MDTQKGSVVINGIEYFPASEINLNEEAEKPDWMPYVIIRTYSAGVFAGYRESANGQEAVMRKVRRIWYWDGAASLSQMAVDGVSKPENCKFSMAVDKEELTQVIETLHCTEKARKNIEGVSIWKR